MAQGARARQFLDPAVVARLGTLELKARTIVEGFLTGLHRSPFKGFSVEFAEYRQYIPGDDLHTIDWKVYARSDRYYIKKFEEETNLDCHLMLDVSASMGYGSHHAMSKFQYGACLAASRPGMPGAPEFIDKWVKWGAGLRGSQALVRGAKARALTQGRYHVSIKDIQALAKPILRHRIMTNFYAESERINSDAIIERLIEAVPVPKSGM